MFSGNLVITGSSVASLIGLTWGGSRYSWTSPHVLVPLIVGVVGIVAFMVYEAIFPKEPAIPMRLLRNRTSVSG